MALLGEIRQRSWLLILGIGLALLAFLVGDAFSGGSGGIFGNPNELGSAGGAPINVQDFNQEYNRLSSNQQYQNVSANYLSELAWNQLVSERLIKDRASDLGLEVTENDKLNAAAQFFRTVNPTLINEQGLVNTELTQQFLDELKQGARAGNRQYQLFYEQWENAKVEQNILSSKYTQLLSSAVLVNDLDAKFDYKSNSENADIEYVLVKYADYAKDHPVEVSDDEILAYVKEHPNRFETEPTVNIAYAYFPGEPSAKDKSEALKEISSYLNPQILEDEANGVVDSIAAFANAKNDSAYVTRFSEVPFDPTYYFKDQLTNVNNAQLKAFLDNPQVGKVVGPIETNNTYNLYKISDAKMVTDSAKTSHILIGFEGSKAAQKNPEITRTMEEAQVLADSLLTIIQNNPAKFNEFASTISDDKVAAEENGSIGWSYKGQRGIDPYYLNYAINNPKGAVDVVMSEFGVHIIRIDEVKQKMGYQIARIAKTVRPSEKTADDLFAKANQTQIDAEGKSANDFVNLATEKAAQVNTSEGVTRFQPNLTGLEQTKKEADILKWAFDKDTNIGEMETFSTQEGGYIIAYLSAKYDEDEPNVAAARNAVEPLVKNEKLFAQIQKEAEGKSELPALATAFNTEVQSSQINFARPIITGAGAEPKVAGAAFAMQPNTLSNAIEGNAGAYFVKVKSINEAANKDNFDTEKARLKAQNKQSINTRLIPSLIDAADVEDNRIEKLK